MLVHHVSRRPESSNIKLFTPRVPDSVGADEDLETKRICVSSSILGAMNAVCLSDDILCKHEPFMLFSTSVPVEKMITPELLLERHGVMDAILTQEHWILDDTVMYGNLYRIKSYRRGNYILPYPDKEERIRRYFSRYPEYEKGLSLHFLLNVFAGTVGLDEDDLLDLFGIKGIRIFTKVDLEAVDG